MVLGGGGIFIRWGVAVGGARGLGAIGGPLVGADGGARGFVVFNDCLGLANSSPFNEFYDYIN